MEGICEQMTPVDGTTLFQFLKNVSFVGEILFENFTWSLIAECVKDMRPDILN